MQFSDLERFGAPTKYLIGAKIVTLEEDENAHLLDQYHGHVRGPVEAYSFLTGDMDLGDICWECLAAQLEEDGESKDDISRLGDIVYEFGDGTYEGIAGDGFPAFRAAIWLLSEVKAPWGAEGVKQKLSEFKAAVQPLREKADIAVKDYELGPGPHKRGLALVTSEMGMDKLTRSEKALAALWNLEDYVKKGTVIRGPSAFTSRIEADMERVGYGPDIVTAVLEDSDTDEIVATAIALYDDNSATFSNLDACVQAARAV